MLRITLGFLAAALGLPILALPGPNGVFWFSMLAMFTVPLTLFVAVPLFYFTRKRVTFWRCVLAGLAVGVVGALLFLLATNVLAARNWAPILIAAGLLSSLIFWLVGVWKNDWFNREQASREMER